MPARTVSLIPHPAFPPGPIRRLDVEATRHESRLCLRFTVKGRVEAVAWPSPTSGGRADDLWRRTCFEAFVSTRDGYREFNLSPSGQWAVYDFTGYRVGMTQAVDTARQVRFNLEPNWAELEAVIDAPPAGRTLALSAVIETLDGAMTYWALAHPSDKPDFHHPDSFVLDLP